MKNKTLVSFLLIFFTASLSIFYYFTSWNVPINSDSATAVLQAYSMIKSNALLEGWFMSTGTYYTTDLIFYAIAALVIGLSSKIIYVITAIQFAVLVVIASIIASKNKEQGYSKFKFVLTFFILVIPSYMMAMMVFSGPMHIGGMIYALIALYGLVYIRNNNYKWAVYTSLLTIALIGDQFILWIFVLPVVMVSIVRILINKNRKKESLIIGFSVFSYIIQFLIQKIFRFNEVNAGNMLFTTYEQLQKNVRLTIEGLLEIYGANFFGKPFTTLDSLVILIHLAILFVIIYVIYINIKTDLIKKDRMAQILVAGIVLNILEYLFSNMAIDINTTRYLIPMFVYSAILFAKTVGEINWPYRNKIIAVSALAVILLLSIPTLKFDRVETNHDRLIMFLESKELTHGYGSYWNASIVTLKSKEEISIRPVVSNGVSISRFDWLSHVDWYNEYTNFLVFDNSNWGNINLENAKVAFGEPIANYIFEDLQILVWDKDLSKIIVK
ncbi:hypothetical protein [Paenibacillus sp. PL91]|uniref:hypothetical protein n=1 Tax=Paenibacillus sp. PL91 TaxID=2729538 RepID=UPI00145E43E2|nr:hypothetical protein [Paenibacillus sp. PL91]MBC9203141.1 hypothetical protein [Paenibacillus sp. PL91]